MKEEKIPTAEEFVKAQTNSSGGRNIYSKEEVAHVAREFTKLHVAAALKAASEKMVISGMWGDEYWSGNEIAIRDTDGAHMALEINKESILTAYPPENIK
jgi:hypothetical protein